MSNSTPTSKSPGFDFAKALLKWFDSHGRKNLPWQHPLKPYRVWLSEVMLQQTQVETVIPYFRRFEERFPSVKSLANSPLDDVLHLWTGLGYYARARNLHKCAQQVVEQYDGIFPDSADLLAELPGIGKSTAAAIASIAYNKSTAILDGNVKRVLARFHAVEGWPGQRKIHDQLWVHADSHMPTERCADYTQAIMDLGATLCKRSKPDCQSCPMQNHCKAFAQQNVLDYPGKKPRKVIPTKSTTMLICQDQNNQILLEKRPTKGIWGGLWSFVEFDDTEQALTYALKHGSVQSQETWSQITHVFSHYKLLITPIIVEIKPYRTVAEQKGVHWVKLPKSLELGLAAPVKRLIEDVQELSDSLI